MEDELKRRALRIERARTRDAEPDPEEPNPDEPVEPTPEEPELIGYVTVPEANEYIVEHYIFEDELRTKWMQLDDDAKKALLRKSLISIELLPYIGLKTGGVEQELAFPRCPSEEVPWQVKAAQIENALSKCSDDTNEDAKFYERLWTWGIQSYTLGKLSEKVSQGGFGGGILGAIGTAQETGITSAIAARLLRPFLMGGYSIESNV